MANEPLLLYKLDQFIRKYYKNRLIRGVLWVSTLLTAFYLVLVGLEYLFNFNHVVRTCLFFLFTSGAIFSITRLVMVPAAQLLKIGKLISHEMAAEIIGKHFGEIQDKLLNTLQLIKQQDSGEGTSELLSASIEQKTFALKVFRFNVIIDFRKNLPYLRYAMIPAGMILLLVVINPDSISEPTRRIVQFNRDFVKPLPFRVEVITKNLVALQQEDFDFRIRVTGEEIPGEIFIQTNALKYRMTRSKGFVYEYLFKSLQANIRFNILAGEYRSEVYEVKVFPKPIILNFDVVLTYPVYINKPEERVENIGDFNIPEGTVVSWAFRTRDVSAVHLRFDNGPSFTCEKSGHVFTFTQKVMKSVAYSVTPCNDNSYKPDSLNYHVVAITDGFPSVFLTESVDSSMSSALFFKGTIKDDYGFTKLTFNYQVFSKNDTAGTVFRVEPLSIDKSVNNQVFYYTADLAKLLPVAGQGMNYFFEVWDNDGIHGPKSTKSELKKISTPSLEEISNHTEKNEAAINSDLQKSISDSRLMKKTMDDLNRKLVDQSSVSWQEKKKVEDLINEAKSIENKVEEIKKKNRDNIKNEEKFLKTNERIVEKQKQINELMDQLFSEEMKKMVEEMKSLLNQIDKTKLADLLEKMKMSNKELENQLDRNLSLMKQLEFDRKMEEMVKDLRNTADKQDKLASESEKNQKSGEDLMKEQQQLKEKADSLSKHLESLEKMGKELETQVNMGDTKTKRDSISKHMAESQNQLKKNQGKQAAESQKKAAKAMRDLARQMEDSQEESEDNQLAEDASNIRMILENLVRLSFDQEEMIGITRMIGRADPRYPQIVFRQKEFSEKLKVVEDSLNAIAKRQVMIKPVISKEIASITLTLAQALDAMDSHDINKAVTKQQFTMTAINNLAILLNEALDKMNEQMSQSMKSKAGNKQCNKPSSKGGKMSAKGMKDLQQKIGQQLEKLKSGLEGATKQGMNSKQGQSGMNREVAKLAAQQEALRNEMQKYQDEMGSKGVKDQGSLNEAAKEMEQMEKDLINKRITQETILRQQKIMTRLLESEKAEQMREQEEKRESTEAKNQQIGNPGLNYQYNMKKRASMDNLQLVLPALNSFYKTKVNSYIVKIEH